MAQATCRNQDQGMNPNDRTATCSDCGRNLVILSSGYFRSHKVGSAKLAAAAQAAKQPTCEDIANQLSDEMMELRESGDFQNPRSRAWDSAVDNADLTAREERIERWSARYCEVLVSSFESVLNDNL